MQSPWNHSLQLPQAITGSSAILAFCKDNTRQGFVFEAEQHSCYVVLEIAPFDLALDIESRSHLLVEFLAKVSLFHV